MSGLTVKEIYKDIFVLSFGENFFHANATVIFSEIGPVLIDCFRDRMHYDAVKEFINSQGYESPYAIIYTHWHIDHTAGNRFDSCTNIIAHKSLLKHFDDFNDKHIDRIKSKGILEHEVSLKYPNILIEHEMLLDTEDRKLRLIHCPGHSCDSIIVFDEKSRVLIAGDNLVNEEEPFIMPPATPVDEPYSDRAYFEQAYKLMEGYNPSIFVPGHGSISKPESLLKLNKERYQKGIAEKLQFVE